jgi:hypothetical protein
MPRELREPSAGLSDGTKVPLLAFRPLPTVVATSGTESAMAKTWPFLSPKEEP